MGPPRGGGGGGGGRPPTGMGASQSPGGGRGRGGSRGGGRGNSSHRGRDGFRGSGRGGSSGERGGYDGRMHGGGRGGGTDRGRGGFRGGGRGAGRGGSALGGRDSRDEFRLGRAAQKVEIPVGLKPLGLPGGGIDGRWFEATGGEGGAEESRKRKKKGGGGSAAEGGDAESLRAEASKRLEQDVALADQKSGGRGGSNAEFLKKVVSSGTLTDKMASMMLMVQEAPMHRLRVLDALVKMAERKGKREQVLALETLKDLFVNALLPPRKLRYFHDLTAAHGGAAAPERSRVLWFFEDALKRRFAAFVAALESATHDPLVHVRSKAIRMAFDLLRTVPEQEAAMLFMLVNKLGDPDKKVASSAMHLLNRLLQEHPAMKGVVAAEVQRIMFRPNVSDKAKHYATAFLAQVMLSHRDKALARSMLSSYLALFQAAVAAKSFDSKTLTAILTGINRALPYVGAADEEGPPAPGKRRGGPPRTAGAADEGAGALETHLDNIFKMVYVASFNTAVQALQVLMQATAVGALAGESGAGGSSTRAASGFGTDVPPVPSTRFYRALYAKLASPDLRVSNKHSLFLNLLFKAVKADPLPARAAAFLKRLLQVAASSPVSFAAGALILVSEVLAARENVWRLLTSPPKPDKPSKPGGGAGGGEKDGEDDSGSDEGASGDPSGSDEEAGGHTVKAGARVTLTGLVGAAHLNGMQGVARELDGDRWVVVVRGEAAPLRVKPQNLRPAQGAGNAAAGGLGAATAAAAAADPALAHLLRYDPMKREPEHAGAAGAQLWELVALQAHFHPTIRHFTAQLLKRARITYPGDPLEDFTAMRFLDKFVYKNPKKRRGKGDGDGSDDEEEARPVSRMAKDKGPGRESEPVVNSVEWMQRSSEALAPEDMFFFRYFSQKDERQSDAKRKAKAKEMDERREREEMEEVEAVTGVEDSGDSGSEGSDGEAAFSASGSEESDVDSSDEEVMDMGGGSGAEVDDDDSDGEDMDMGGGFAAEEEAEASGEEDSEDGYSDMEDISDDEAPVKGKKVASKGDAEQEMMREIEAGIGSDDSDVEFNTRLQAGGGGNWKDEGEDMDNDSDDSSAGGEEAMGGMFHEGDHSDEDGDARGGKKARKGKGAVFASADDYAHLLENDPGSGGESDDQMGGRRGGGRGGGRGRGRGAGNRGRGGAGRGRGR